MAILAGFFPELYRVETVKEKMKTNVKKLMKSGRTPEYMPTHILASLLIFSPIRVPKSMKFWIDGLAGR